VPLPWKYYYDGNVKEAKNMDNFNIYLNVLKASHKIKVWQFRAT